MANYTLTQPTGEDYYLQALQVRMYADLPVRLGLDATKWNSFGRVYRNHNQEEASKAGYIPEAYYNGQYVAGDGTSNRGGLFFESGFMVSFFGTPETAKTLESGFTNQPVELIFFIDLSILTPLSTTITNGVLTDQRIDEVVTNIIYDYVNLNGCGFRVKQVVKDVDEVLKRYSGSQKKISLTRDMQPFYCFKIVGELIFNRYLKTY